MADQIFTYGPSNVGSLIATTLSNYGRELSDNVHKAIPLFAWLSVKKKITEDGGATIVRPVVYSSNSTAAFYASDDVLDTTINFSPAWGQLLAA